MSDTDPLLRMAALAVISGRARKAYDQARADVALLLKRGERHKPRADVSAPAIGAVEMTDPKPVVAVTNPDALVEWMAANYPEHVVTDYQPGPDTAAITAVLFAHAPHLLRTVRRVHPEVQASMLAATEVRQGPCGPGGETDVPGITWSEGSPVVRCVPAEGALPEVIGLIRSGRLELEDVLTLQIEGTVDGDAH